MNNLDILGIKPLDVEKSQDVVERIQGLSIFVGNMRLVKYNQNVVQIMNHFDKYLHLITVKYASIHRIRETLLGLLSPLGGRMSSENEHVVIINTMFRVLFGEFANNGEHRASFTRLCRRDCQGV